MKITKDQLFIIFALWAGAWATVHLMSAIIFEIQMVGYISGRHGIPFDLSGTPFLGASLVVLLSARWMQRIGWRMVLVMAFFGLAYEYLNYFSGVLYVLRLDDPFYVGGSYYPFDWSTLSLEIAGYVIGGLVVAPNWGLRRPGRAMLDWLQFDTEAYGRWWRWWLSLPLWSYASPIKRGLRGFVPVFLAFASAISLVEIMGSQLFPLTYRQNYISDHGTALGILQKFAAGYGLYLLLILFCSFAAGRILYGLGYGVRWIGAGIAAIILQLPNLQVSVNYYLQQAASEGPMSPTEMLSMSIGPMTWIVLMIGLAMGRRCMARV